MNLFFFCQENTEFGRQHVLEGAKHCPNGFVPWSASTYSPGSSQLRTPRWIQRRPRCARPQSWRTPAWPPRTWETRTYRWQPCPLSVSHISSGCWQDGKSAPEVPCRHRSNAVRWLHRTKKGWIWTKRGITIPSGPRHLGNTRHTDSCILKKSSLWSGQGQTALAIGKRRKVGQRATFAAATARGRNLPGSHCWARAQGEQPES